MKLVEFLPLEMVLPDLKAERKPALLVELAQACAEFSTEVDPERLIRVLRDRERLGSTGVGDGVALPHGKLPGLSRLLVGFGRSRVGVDFESQDGQPAHLFFLLVAPEDSSGQHLRTLARISRICKTAAFRERLLDAVGQEALYSAILEEDGRE